VSQNWFFFNFVHLEPMWPAKNIDLFQSLTAFI
jgi:hypothetical protein